MELPKRGQCWRHYKGGYESLYEIIGTGYHTETNDAVVIYRKAEADVEGNKGPLFVRPLSVFLGTTDEHKERFTKERDKF